MRALGACVLILLAIQCHLWKVHKVPLKYRYVDVVFILGACLLLTGGK